MTDAELLYEVKNRIGITGDYQDTTIQGHIEDVKEYLEDAGVPRELLNSKASVGIVARGVSDLWNYGSGDGVLSPYFYERATQLSYRRD